MRCNGRVYTGYVRNSHFCTLLTFVCSHSSSYTRIVAGRGSRVSRRRRQHSSTTWWRNVYRYQHPCSWLAIRPDVRIWVPGSVPRRYCGGRGPAELAPHGQQYGGPIHHQRPGSRFGTTHWAVADGGARVRTLTLAVRLPPPVGKRRVRVWLRQVVSTAWLKWPGVHVHVATYLPVRDPRAHPEIMLPVVNFNRNLGTAVRILQQANRDKMVMFVPWHKWMLAAGREAPEDGVWETVDLIWLRGLLQELLDVDGN